MKLKQKWLEIKPSEQKKLIYAIAGIIFFVGMYIGFNAGIMVSQPVVDQLNGELAKCLTPFNYLSP